jgi:hypothetical protein
MLDQLRDDMLRDLRRLGHLPPISEARLQRLLRISVEQVFHLCLDFLAAPARRSQLLHDAEEMFYTLVAGAMALEASKTSA